MRPLDDQASVVRLERNGAPADAARAGDNAEVTLSGIDAARVVVGNVLCKAGSVVPAVRRFKAQIVALPALEVGSAAMCVHHVVALGGSTTFNSSTTLFGGNRRRTAVAGQHRRRVDMKRTDCRLWHQSLGMTFGS